MADVEDRHGARPFDPWAMRAERRAKPDHVEPKTAEEIEAFKRRWKDDLEGFEHRWSLNRFPNVNIARDLSPDERAQRDRERALLGLEGAAKVKKGRKKKGEAETEG